MNPLLKFYRFLNILSIDVALGAVCCSVWFAKVFHVQLRPYALLALGFTVWIIYTTDHLMDAWKIKNQASTERHRFHQKNFKMLVMSLAIAVVIDLVLIFFIRTKVLHAGLILTGIVISYLLVNRWLGFAKEFIIAIVYCGGVLLPALSLLNNSLGVPEILLIMSFLLTALINLILFSRYDAETDRRDGYNSFVLEVGVTKTYYVLISLFVFQVMLLALLFTAHAWSCALVMLSMNTVLFLLFLKPSYFRQNDAYRLCGDVIFLFPVFFLVIG